MEAPGGGKGDMGGYAAPPAYAPGSATAGGDIYVAQPVAQPVAVAAAAAVPVQQMMQLVVTVPAGVAPGGSLQIAAPDGSGRQFQFVVPPGSAPGSQMTVSIPAAPAPVVVAGEALGAGEMVVVTGHSDWISRKKGMMGGWQQFWGEQVGGCIKLYDQPPPGNRKRDSIPLLNSRITMLGSSIKIRTVMDESLELKGQGAKQTAAWHQVMASNSVGGARPGPNVVMWGNEGMGGRGRW